MQQNDDGASPNDCFLTPEFDFNEWKKLHEKDPHAFEIERENLMNNFIESAPDAYKRRLKGMMFQINAIRSRSKTPLQACIDISGMMHSTVSDLYCYLDDLKYSLASSSAKPSFKIVSAKQNSKITSATILDFER